MKFWSRKSELKKVYKRIDKIAKSGSDGIFDYYLLIDELISKSKFSEFCDILDIYYNFPYDRYPNVEELKKISWTSILFKTRLKSSEDIYSVANKLGIYQIGLDYFKENDDDLQFYIGSIEEVDIYSESIDFFGVTQNEYQEIIKNKTLKLRAKNNLGELMEFNNWDIEKPYEVNLVNLYKIAFDYLLE